MPGTQTSSHRPPPTGRRRARPDRRTLTRDGPGPLGRTERETTVADNVDVELAAVQRELETREPLFHRTERGTTRADFEAMTTENFWEVGASGACYDREFVWSVLQRRYAEVASDDWAV